jgi:hypothetical protein
MSSTRAGLSGAQEPRVARVPSALWSHADDAAFLASSYGLTPDVWQADVLAAWLGEKRDGQWAAGRCGLSVPRQNGKNALLEVRELYGMVALGEKFLHTAHEVKTARKAFVRLCSFFENERKFPELAALVQEIRRTNGQEAVVLTNGGSVEFVARSRGSGRGYTVDVLVMDEAQELSDEQLEALLPTISAAPTGNPQQIYTGTPPGPGSVGEVFTRTRDAGVAGKDKRLAWHEWSVEGRVDVTDRSLWAATNPALGSRLSAAVIEDELAAMSPDGFARERLGRWASDSIAPSVIDWQRWSAQAGPAPVGRLAYAVRFSADGSRVALAVGVQPDAGVPHVELVELRSMSVGTAWLVDWFTRPPAGGSAAAARWRGASRIVVDGKAGAGAFVNALRAAGVPERVIHTPSTDEVIAAHAAMAEAVRAGGVTHFAEEHLDAAVRGAGKRSIGSQGGWGWKPLSPDVDVTPLDVVTLAFHAVTTGRRGSGRSSGEGRRGVVL